MPAAHTPELSPAFTKAWRPLHVHPQWPQGPGIEHQAFCSSPATAPTSMPLPPLEGVDQSSMRPQCCRTPLLPSPAGLPFLGALLSGSVQSLRAKPLRAMTAHLFIPLDTCSQAVNCASDLSAGCSCLPPPALHISAQSQHLGNHSSLQGQGYRQPCKGASPVQSDHLLQSQQLPGTRPLSAAWRSALPFQGQPPCTHSSCRDQAAFSHFKVPSLCRFQKRVLWQTGCDDVSLQRIMMWCTGTVMRSVSAWQAAWRPQAARDHQHRGLGQNIQAAAKACDGPCGMELNASQPGTAPTPPPSLLLLHCSSF